MQNFLLLLLTSGLAALQTTLGQGRCSYAGVVHLNGGSHYSLDFQQAMQLCQSLGYSLATEEQLTKAYNKGLKTCRYGWIESQKISFLQNNVDPNCSSVFNYTGIVFHDENADNLHDVYCFTQSDSVDISCEDAVTSVSSQSTPSTLTTTIATPDPEEDVLDEVIADGFIVDVKGTTSTVQTLSTEDTHTTATTPNRVNHPDENPSQAPQEDSVTETVAKDPEVTTVVDTSSTKELTNSENAGTPPSIVLDHDTTAFPEEKSEASTDFGAPTKVATKETTNGIGDMSEESSGMFPEVSEEKNKDLLLFSTSLSTPVRGLHHLTLDMAEGSGMESESTTSDRLTAKPTIIIEEPLLEEEEVFEQQAKAPYQPNGHKETNPGPTTSAQVEEGTPGWLIIFAFCMALGAIVCVLAGIATKDMWYGPSRRSLNITQPGETDEEYGKAATLPLSEKEQELVTLMNEQKNDNEYTIISLEENPEKEYLM